MACKQAVVVHSEMDQFIKGLNTDILKLISTLKETKTKPKTNKTPTPNQTETTKKIT